MRILALHLSNFIEYAQLRGLTEQEMLSGLQESIPDFSDNTSTISVVDFFSVVEYIVQHLNDELLGIRIGSFMNLKALGLIYQISIQTTTVHEALFYLKDYVHATLPIIRITTSVSEESAAIHLDIERTEGNAPRVILENILTIIAKELRIMTINDIAVEIRSPFCNEFYPQDWVKGEHFGITFKNAVLRANIQDRSRWKLDILVPEYLKIIEYIKNDNTFSTKVKIAMLSMARPELPNLNMVADTFNMTPRTFQRRLDLEKTSFRNINIDLKKQISLLFISHQRFSINEISDVLGFSEPASFIHSFKKWHGNSPEKYRQRTYIQ